MAADQQQDGRSTGAVSGGQRGLSNFDRFERNQAHQSNNNAQAAAAPAPAEEAKEPEPPPYEPPETGVLRDFFSRSEVFASWEKTRGDGWTNQNVANFFNKKKTSHDNERDRGKKGHGTDMRKIRQLFNRFYRYALTSTTVGLRSQSGQDCRGDWFM